MGTKYPNEKLEVGDTTLFECQHCHHCDDRAEVIRIERKGSPGVEGLVPHMENLETGERWAAKRYVLRTSEGSLVRLDWEADLDQPLPPWGSPPVKETK